MNAKLMRDFVNWPTTEQEELLRMMEESDRHREQNELYRAQLTKHYNELYAKVPWWRKLLMESGRKLYEWAAPKWLWGVQNDA